MDNHLKRQKSIIKDLLSTKVRPVSELMEILSISRETLRKDLIELEQQKLIKREFGRIRLNEDCSTESLLKFGLLPKKNRLQLLEKEFQGNQERRISFLAQKFNITMETIRSDLKELESKGIIMIRHGSAKGTAGNSSETENSSFSEQILKIGKQTSLHIGANETIFLDGGAVCRFIAINIPNLTKITIVTNSLEVLTILNKREYAYPVQLIPGVLLKERQIIISNNPDQLSKLHIDKAFFSSLLYSSGSFYFKFPEDSDTLHSIAKASQAIYLILDSLYLGTKGHGLFHYSFFRDKIKEILIDDEISQEKLRLEFPASFPLVTCGSNYSIRLAKREKWKIGLLINKNRNQFVKGVHDGILQQALSVPSLSIEVTECEVSYKSVAENLDRLISDGIDIVIDYSLCIESLYYVSEMCAIKKIPLISVDLASNNSYFYGANNQLAGSIAGENAFKYISETWNGDLEEIIIIGEYTKYPPHKIRILSTLDYIKDNLSFQESRISIINWDDKEPDSAKNLITVLKEKKDKKKLILFYNLHLLLSSYKYIQPRCDKENTAIIVQNYSHQIGELMNQKDSLILGCVDYDNINYGEGIISIVKQIINGQRIPKTTYTSLSWKSNNPLFHSA